MRRVPAIAIILTLLAAPLALIANSDSIARYQKELSMTAVDDHCGQAGVTGICGCHPGSAPAPVIVSPLPDLVLHRSIQLPSQQVRMTESFIPAFVVLPGFLPTPFHPPRG